MLQDPICVIGRPLGRLSAKSQAAFCGLSRGNLQSSNSPAASSIPSPQVIKVVHEKFDETSLASEGSWAGFARTGFACLRLARLHTLMAWAIFPAPAIYTVVLYHSTGAMALDASEKILGCMRLSVVMFLCVLSYRAAGLAWDDLIDRDFDAQVTRSMTRPLPAGDISVDGALLYIIFQIGCTIILLQALTGPEVFVSFIISGALFGIYPYLKRWTNYTQIFGALLIAMGVIQGWLACATLYNPVPGFTPGWTHALAIIQRDWLQLVPIFLMEFTYELAHELIYGCQDTAEDIMIGLHSLSILCGYEQSRTLGTSLMSCFCCFLAYCGRNADVVGWQASIIPPLMLVYWTSRLDLSTPASCGKWAGSAIKVKVVVTLVLMLCFIQKEMELLELIRSSLSHLAKNTSLP
ncbi:hypothetical protein PGT21_005274 [Puccinia graminis f. sp. tritici]|uniref:Uncharacterized protein n=2 Tax=Puccinia graminis f. sp. tritici TaxID=56615 RepID=E3KTF8_PUCGT|nr:uncharacterized protein PGTG_13954 [Puccinia graminis f. sp. tritici CRL 75-36-700-3]EFP87583.2 hypothetical protein PGTG_13954 [Puccinia graminis f. sp. tritici CRL 75-36-700-3]KAA1070255.1 hypothetical protein PGT21_005274 [Puccinia graminis f. sp. tritici]KAA1090145.1 hypothetical protein PGTUg99_036531 [Puccinia graminis f. sp. tritici]